VLISYHVLVHGAYRRLRRGKGVLSRAEPNMHSLSLISWFGARAAWTLFAGVALSGCMSSNDIQCHVSTAPAQAPADGTVTYHAAISGDAHIDSIINKTDAGPQTVSHPPLPFELDAAVTSGTPLGIIATGWMEEGANIVAGYTFVDALGASPDTASASCR